MPASLWIITCMSAYICLRLARSVSPRAATSSWSNFSFFKRDSFHWRVGLEELRQQHVGAGPRVDVAEAHGAVHPVVGPVAVGRHALDVEVQADLLAVCCITSAISTEYSAAGDATTGTAAA